MSRVGYTSLTPDHPLNPGTTSTVITADQVDSEAAFGLVRKTVTAIVEEYHHRNLNFELAVTDTTGAANTYTPLKCFGFVRGFQGWMMVVPKSVMFRVLRLNSMATSIMGMPSLRYLSA